MIQEILRFNLSHMNLDTWVRGKEREREIIVKQGIIGHNLLKHISGYGMCISISLHRQFSTVKGGR